MNIAISNIAWNHSEDKKILEVLKNNSISAIEIAPTKIWENPINESNNSLDSYKNFWEKNGIRIVAAQSVLFGHPELKIFEDKNTRMQTYKYLEKMISVCARLGAKAIVFGSPSNRSRNGVSSGDALAIAYDFFNEMGNVSKKYGIFFCIEPNPVEYGTDFINNANEAIDLVEKINNSHFRLHLDTGVMFVNNENYESSIKRGFKLMKHFHISEKGLAPIGYGEVPHEKIARELKSLNYDNYVSIEMRGKNNLLNDKIVDKSLKIVNNFYA